MLLSCTRISRRAFCRRSSPPLLFAKIPPAPWAHSGVAAKTSAAALVARQSRVFFTSLLSSRPSLVSKLHWSLVGVTAGLSSYLYACSSGLRRADANSVPVALPPGGGPLIDAVVKPQLELRERYLHYAPHMSLREWLTTFLGGLVLLPLRALIIAPCVMACGVLSYISLIGYKEGAPVARWRRRLLFGMRLLIRFSMFVAGFYWIKVKGSPAKSYEAPIIVANHTNFFDAVFFAYHRLPSFIGKRELLDIPMFSWLVQGLHIITVDRKCIDSRKETYRKIHERCQAIKERRSPFQIVIFPEGTQSNGTVVLRFRLGAFATGEPVQPVCIRYPHQHFNPVFSHDRSRIWMMVRVLSQLYNRMEVSYLPVYVPSKEEKENPSLYALHVQHQIAEYLGRPAVDYSPF